MDLPLRPSEAADLAALIFETAEGKPLSDELRNRIAARAAARRFETITPHYGSLERDPVHHSTYYIAVDTAERATHLLHLAVAAAPTSSIFQKPLLIGRMRRPAGPEVVINSVPFGPSDGATLERFVSQIDPAFLPRPHGSRTAIVAGIHDPAAMPAVFDAFRGIWKRTRRNVASIGATGDLPAHSIYDAALWAAIRAGWRDGYSAVVRISAPLETAKVVIAEAAAFSTFACDPGALVGEEALTFCDRVYEHIRQARSALKINRPFDFELALDRAPSPTAPEELAFCLEWLRSHGHAAQLAAPHIAGADESRIRELAAVCRQFQCGLDCAIHDTSQLEAISSVTAGNVTCSLWQAADPSSLGCVAESLLG